MTAPSRDLRTVLREKTYAQHRRLDSSPEQRALVRPGLTLTRYAAILRGYQRAHVNCEAELDRTATARPQPLPAFQPRLPAIAADLAQLPGGPHAAQRALTRRNETVPDPASAPGRYLGFRYVLEGSTQGGRFIAGRLRDHLPELAAGPFGYWRLLEQQAQVWPAFTAWLEHQPATGALADAAIQGAHEAFDAFLQAFGVDAAVRVDAR